MFSHRLTIPALLWVLVLVLIGCAPLTAPVSETAADIYADPSGRFTVPIPTNWHAQQADGYGILTSPDDGITAYVLALESQDLLAAIDSAWQQIDPAFDLPVDEVIEEPATRVERAVTVVYDTGDEEQVVIAGGWQHEGIAYLEIFRGDLVSVQKRISQLQIISTGFDILALSDEDLSGVQAQQVDDALLSELEAYIVEAMEKFGVPGAAVAITQGDEIVYAKGFGFRDPASGEPMTTDTSMMIGSTSKTLTTMLMAVLVDQGRMTWDTPVQEILPSFAVADPVLSERITMRNMVCACTGVPRRDWELVFNANDLEAEDIIESLANFQFFTDFGEAFQYSNQMVAAGGYAAAAAAGGQYGHLYEAYAGAMEDHVLNPIGMPDTTLSMEDVLARGNYAVPNGLDLGFEYSPIPLEYEEFVLPIAPAGAYWSTVMDMARYLITELNAGIGPDGNRVVSEENLHLTWEPQVAITADASYGLGWIVSDYQGQPLIAHGGNTLGYTSDLAFLPQSGIGITVLTNGRMTNFFNEAVRYRLLELVFDREPEVDEGASFAYERLREIFAQLKEGIGEPLDEQALIPLLGTYYHEDLGTVFIELEDGMLTIDAGEFRVPLLPNVDDRGEPDGFIIYDAPMTGAVLRFDTDAQDGPLLVMGSGVVEYAFRRQE